jgi:hypothetical protein
MTSHNFLNHPQIHYRNRQNHSPAIASVTLASNQTIPRLIQALVLSTTLIAGFTCYAQQPMQSVSGNGTPANNPVIVPSGTRIALVLTHPIQSRSVRRGDDIYAQITSPVTSGNEVVLPPGTFVQGKVDKLGRNGSRAQLHLQSMSVIFPDGYVAPFSGPLDLESDEGYALTDPGKGRVAGMVAAPLAGLGIGALIGNAAHTRQSSTLDGTTISSSTPKGLAIGSLVGLAAGGAVSLFLLGGSHQFFLDVGSPVEMVLGQPLTLQQERVAAEDTQFEQHPVTPLPIAQRPRPPAVTDPGTCYTPGTPGTPDTDIPGTPAIGDSPGTPPTHIPGIPATPPTPHPCP